MILAALTPWLYHPLTAQVIALTAATSDDPLLFLLNFGTLGVWVVCSITGLQPTRGEMKAKDAEIARLVEDAKRRDERDRAKDQAVEALINLMTSRTLPTLATAVAEMPTAPPPLGKLEGLLERLESRLSDDHSS